ncbi:hypothetical protein DNTS_006159 [Danionella cerebrum]|uniref:Bis(monoacylglycero)phosphate synthase CLN5 n=1 Tax=Danionella cerebrum TaxID=2873325 RepID=A0A553NRW3_9TELE|nr:hypothetical protein DNTS_006159 [Danionella translucida]
MKSAVHSLLVLLQVCSVELFASGRSSGGGGGGEQVWPVPYKRVDSRPDVDPFCQALYPFCPAGDPDGQIPVMSDTDTISIFRLQTPVWEFKYGNVLGRLHVMHDAIGFASSKTGRNFTMEWYELFQLGNCTFPHEREGLSAPFWCNQGAACFYGGIDDLHWKQNGTLEKIGEISGATFNELADWVQEDNRTGVFYETWAVKSSPGENATTWFESYDCSQFVHRAYKKLLELGAQLFSQTPTKYTKIYLYSAEPLYLGDDAIFQQTSTKDLATDIRWFYHLFRSHQTKGEMFQSLLEAVEKIVLEKTFYFYYNYQYWKLPMKYPYLNITYEEIAFP